jgi:hypothetical protein
MAALVVLVLDIFFLSNKNDWSFLYPIGVANTVVLFEMGCVVKIVKDVLN